MQKKLFIPLWVILTMIVACDRSPAPKNQIKSLGSVVLGDSRTQIVEFIGYYHSIKLTSKQEKIKEAALSAIPAPCCSEFSIATCCCPCNLAKSVWGLSNYLIAKHNYNEQQVKQAVVEWFQTTNPGGYSGDSCHIGRCNKPFSENGCGGMSENHLL